MSAAVSARIRGMKLGAEPRKLAILGGLVALAVGAYFYNSGGDSAGSVSTGTAVHPASTAPLESTAPHPHVRKRIHPSDRNTLRMQEVTAEAQRGDIDPTLRLDLLQRLKGVKFTGASRSLFEPGPAVITPQMAAAKPVKIMPGPLPGHAGNPAGGPSGPAGAAPIPLKFYGFAAPVNASGVRRGFFLDEDNVVVADEGETVKGRYRIISLQPKSAEVEDLLTKNRQSLPIVPEMASNAF
ncbi:MAG: hypothetical protein WAM39_01970 [Bryobacteraceae bacterium]